MTEWKSPFNSFNSLKALCWRDRFEQIMNGEIPKPVSVTVDATNICNLRCTFCHYYEFRKEQQRTVPSEELLALPDIIKKLGAFSVCFAGGGEPLLHPDAGLFMRKLKDIGINVGIVTNGVFIDKFIDDILYSCRWVGISVDAATINTYKELKGGSQNDFVRVINNIRLIADRRKDSISPSVGFKFLIHSVNYMEILDAIRLARSIGADDFHGRPAYHHTIKWDEQMIEHALEQIKIGQNIFETQKFRVFGVTHKFDKAFKKKIVDKCEVTPIAGLTFAADGYCYVCCVPEKTKIETDKGGVNVEDIQKNDKVLTHLKRYKKVKKTYVRDANELLKIHSTGWFEPLSVTPEHPVLAIKEKDRYCSFVGKFCPPISNWKKCVGCKHHKKIYPKFINAEALEKGDWLFTPFDKNEIFDKIDLVSFSTYRNKKRGFLKYKFDSLILDEDLCWLIGLFLAEGNVIQTKSRLDAAGLHFSLGIGDMPFIPKLIEISERIFKIKPSLYARKNVIGITIPSVILGNIFYNLIGCYCDKKRLPNKFMKLSINMQKRILEGWCDGDGFHRETDDTYHITTTSKELLYQMWKISLRCGYAGATYDWKVLGKNRKQAYTLFINKHKIKNRNTFFFNGYFVSKIKNIDYIKKRVKVFNLEVEGDNSYVASSKAVHNCDLRGEEQGRLCRWNEILDVWGSDKHKELINKIDPKKCPNRCTFNIYQEILDSVFREDRMTYLFP